MFDNQKPNSPKSIPSLPIGSFDTKIGINFSYNLIDNLTYRTCNLYQNQEHFTGYPIILIKSAAPITSRIKKLKSYTNDETMFLSFVAL